MDPIEKALARLTEKERSAISGILGQLLANNFIGLDIKKLKGQKDIFRARKGNFRIIYRLTPKGIFILAIERRSENTYKNF